MGDVGRDAMNKEQLEELKKTLEEDRKRLEELSRRLDALKYRILGPTGWKELE